MGPNEDLINRLRKRAEIRRQIPTRKSVQAGEPDRIADLLDEAADVIAFYDDAEVVAMGATGTTTEIKYGPPRFLGDFAYKYNEGEILREAAAYIAKTYGEHYVGSDNVQLMDLVFSDGEGIPAARFNVQKYVRRFGKKSGNNIDDLFKAMHYLIFMIHAAKLMEKKGE